MSENPIIIKSNPYGISVVMDETLPFEEFKEKLIEKFNSSEKFFKNADLALGFEGKKLSSKEVEEILAEIKEKTKINVVSIIDNDLEKRALFKRSVEISGKDYINSNAEIITGQIRSGQVCSSEKSLVVIGDVNPGAVIEAKGNIIVIGSLKGKAFAGCNGDEEAFVIALNMQPVQIKIGNVIARSSDSSDSNEYGAMRAFVEDNRICIEMLNKK
ncbi:septum site-determining protein MinC [Acetitomaculum ruminis DSM 5522]|uniref:Probable septum site-determining protein MinC n=1 Tax=Acetitomaculum ruminis DSM 5522 TaxID=1120918 RepID=A0A1I0V5V9_9FIRM|nr:septum site-determining protein MinC [Acetitomaculum ruminis]SFA71453.1 septum site-determining protein MinC [Acetitomaculum ruminis DSM 5522]